MGVSSDCADTAIGVLPLDWELSSIGSICRLINGRGFKPFEWQASGLPIIRIQNLNGSNEFNYYQGPYDAKLIVKNGQLLFAWSGSRGTSFGPHIWHGPLGLLNYHTWKVEVDQSSISKRYFYHALQNLTAHIEAHAHGAAALVHTQKWEMETFCIPVPKSRFEQDAIAEALDDVDALIGSLEQLLAKKRQIKQGAMQELLTSKKRLSGFDGSWRRVQFGEVVQLRKERIDPRQTGDQDFCIELEHIQQANGRVVGHTVATTESSLKAVFYKDDILFGKLRAYLKKFWLANRDGVCSTEIWVFTAKSGMITPQFLYQIVRTDSFVTAASSAYGTHMPRSDWNVVGEYGLMLPPIPEQHQIASVLLDMDTEIETLEAKLAKTRQIKLGMMQELLTGRIRLV